MKKTPLYQWHMNSGANMAEFGSYMMPLWYPHGAKQEHLGVITGAGLFDTSHMAVILVKGKAARALLQRTFSKDLDHCLGAKQNPLHRGKCVYGVFLGNNGHVIDDAIVYQVSDDFYMVVVNAAMGAQIAAHLTENKDSQENTAVIDLTDTLGKIDCQGPGSAKILMGVLQNPKSVLADMSYFSFKGWFDDEGAEPVYLQNEVPILLSRTGYTGEFGFELFMPADKLQPVWEMILEAGGKDILTCGLAARDSLRAGAVLPLSHQDIGDWLFLANPWLFALPLVGQQGFTKEFIGASSISTARPVEYTYAYAGYDPRKITPGKESHVLDDEGNIIGTILTCTTDMAIGRVAESIISIASPESHGRPDGFKPKGLSCGFVKVNKQLESGVHVFLSDGKRKLKVEIRRDIRPHRTARCPMGEMI